MKNLKSKVRDFLNSEEGRVGVKAPLAVGVATSGLLLAQTTVSTPDAQGAGCGDGPACDPGENCIQDWCPVILGFGPNWQLTWGVVPCFRCE